MSQQSGADDYLPFAGPPSDDVAQSDQQSSDRALQDTDYDQMVEPSSVDDADQQPLPLDEVLTPTNVDTAVDDARPDQPAEQVDATTPIEPAPDQSITPDHENLGV